MEIAQAVLMWPKVVLADFDFYRMGAKSLYDLAIVGAVAAAPWYLMRNNLREAKDIAIAYAESGAGVYIVSNYVLGKNKASK